MKTTATLGCYSFHTFRVLLSCDNKHSNVTVDGAAGDSSPFFADLHRGPPEKLCCIVVAQNKMCMCMD